MSLVSPLKKPPSVENGWQDRIVADVVNLVLAPDEGGRVRTAQDHSGGRAGGRRRVRRDCEEEGVEAGRVCVIPDDLVSVVDVLRPGHATGNGVVGQGIVKGGVD